MAPRTGSASGAEDTRARIVAATLDTVREHGIAGVSARSIARAGGFNQALIFYHFGSVDGLLMAASRSENERRAALYDQELASVTTLPELTKVARRLHAEEAEQGSVAVLTQMLAGAAASPELAAGLRDGFEPWMAQVEKAVERVLAGGPFDGAVSPPDLAFAVASMFLGMELITGLTPGDPRDDSVLDTLDVLAGLGDTVLNGTLAAPLAKVAARRTRKRPKGQR